MDKQDRPECLEGMDDLEPRERKESQVNIPNERLQPCVFPDPSSVFDHPQSRPADQMIPDFCSG